MDNICNVQTEQNTDLSHLKAITKWIYPLMMTNVMFNRELTKNNVRQEQCACKKKKKKEERMQLLCSLHDLTKVNLTNKLKSCKCINRKWTYLIFQIWFVSRYTKMLFFFLSPVPVLFRKLSFEWILQNSTTASKNASWLVPQLF